MKKVVKVLLLLLVITSVLVGCKKNEGEEGVTPVEKVEYNKAIVIYFSRAGENYSVGTVDVGNTALMAKYIADYLNADTFEILAKNPYPESYAETKIRVNKELQDNARPEILNEIYNLDEYDTVFLGYPIWSGNIPMIVYTFMEKYDLSGKTVIPFNTHEGSKDSGTYDKIKEQLKNSKVNINGLYLTGKEARTEEGKTKTVEWLKSLGY